MTKTQKHKWILDNNIVGQNYFIPINYSLFKCKKPRFLLFTNYSISTLNSSSYNIVQFVNSIRQNLYQQNLMKCEELLLITISGGQDSSCLLFVFYILKTQMNFHFDCIWINHFWQKSSFFTMLHVSKYSFCCNCALNCFVPLKKLVKPQRYSEQNARNWRHCATQRAAVFYNYTICTQGHSKSDRVETIIFNLIRGTGISGISALPWIKRRKIFSTNKHYPVLSHFFKQTHLLISKKSKRY